MWVGHDDADSVVQGCDDTCRMCAMAFIVITRCCALYECDVASNGYAISEIRPTQKDRTDRISSILLARTLVHFDSTVTGVSDLSHAIGES
jgi:hypothetical protein